METLARDQEDFIDLNISGTILQAKESALISVPGSSLEAMFSKRH